MFKIINFCSLATAQNMVKRIHYRNNFYDLLFENCIWLTTKIPLKFTRTTSKKFRNWIYHGSTRLSTYFYGLRFRTTNLESSTRRA